MNWLITKLIAIIILLSGGIIYAIDSSNILTPADSPRELAPPITITSLPPLSATPTYDVIAPPFATPTNVISTQPPFLATSTPLMVTQESTTNYNDSVIHPVLSLVGTSIPDPIRVTESN